MLEELTEQAKLAVEQVLDAAKLERGGLFVVGCSSSEVCGSKIGTNSSLETAQAVLAGIYPVLKERGIYLAAQCCEHLNRAIIIEREAAQKFGYEEVNVVPQPVAVEEVHADAGMDIGGTLIGMHLKRVAVPVRIAVKQIGEANLLCARTRPKFIGGVRAHYDESKL